MSLPSPPTPLSTPSRPRPRPTHRTSGSSGGGGSFDAAALDSNNPMLAGLSLSGFTPGGPVPAGYSYLDKAAPTLRTSTRSGPRDAASIKKKAPRPATRFVPPRSTSPVSPHDRAIPSSLAASPSPPRSKTLPSLSQLNTTLTSLASLPANPRHWTPSHVSLYLSHVLSLAPRPIIDDVARFVRSEQLSGPGFLRLREGQLEARGMNPRWRRLLCEASERLRREGLRRRIWSRPAEEDGEGEEGKEPAMEDLLGGAGGAGELTPGQQRLMTATLKRIRDRKAVRGLIDAIESSPPKDLTDLPPSHAGTPTRKIKKAFPALDGVGSTERSPPTVIEPPFGEGYVRRQANSFSSQENLAKLAREGAKAQQRIRPSRTRMWTNGANEASSEASLPSSITTSAISEFGSRPALHSSVSSPGDLQWAHTHTAHAMSASSSSSSSLSTFTSASSITSALGYESDLSATSESDVADYGDEVGGAGQREEQQQPFWMTTLPIDEEMVRAMLAEQEEGEEEATVGMEERLLHSDEDKEEVEVVSSADEDAYFQSSREDGVVGEPEAQIEPLAPINDQLSIAEELNDSLTLDTLTPAARRLFADLDLPAASIHEEQPSTFLASEDNEDVFTCQRHEDPTPEPDSEPEQQRPQAYEHDVEATLRAPRRDCSALSIQSLLLPSSDADGEGERFDTIRLDEDSLATIRQGRRGASSGSSGSQGGAEVGVGGRRGGRRSLQQLSEMFCTPCESAGEEEEQVEQKAEEDNEENMDLEAEETPTVQPEEAEVAIEAMLEELATEPQTVEEAQQEVLEQPGASESGSAAGELEPSQADKEELQVDLPLAIEDEDDKELQDIEQTTRDDLVVPTLTTQHCADTDAESSLEDSTILHLIHTREVSTASSCSPDAFAAAGGAEATDVSADTSLLEAKQEVEEHHEHHETSSNPDDDAHIWYGDGSSLLLLSSLLPDRTEDELLISEHRRLLPSRASSSPKDERERRDLPSPWRWADLVARTPPYLVGLATGVAFVVVSEMVLGMRRR